MIDLKIYLKDLNNLKLYLEKKNFNLEVGALSQILKQYNLFLQEYTTLRQRANQYTQDYKNHSKPSTTLPGFDDIATLKNQTSEKKKKLEEAKTIKTNFLMHIPNIPYTTVPVGENAAKNQVIRQYGKKKEFPFQPKSHEMVAEKYLDSSAAASMSGSRFSIFKGGLAKLHRILIHFMLETHLKKGYEEVYLPYLVHRQALENAGQFPAFVEDVFHIEKRDMFLIPTGEVPLVNLFASQIIPKNILPKKMVAHTPCFREEAGNYGKDTRGFIRQHQFEKIELFAVVSNILEEEAMLNTILNDAEYILQALELPYQVVQLCTGDLGFSAAITYDIEVWMPSQQSYREISSCSACGTFQSRRANAKWKDQQGEKGYLYTLNGSGLAIGRTLAAILENYQTEEGFDIPAILKPYFQ